jgi:hypothetical protein
VKTLAPLLGLLMLLPAPLLAQTPGEAPAATPAALSPADPALLAKATPIAAIVLPDGAMERMMGPMMQKMMEPAMDGMSKMPIRQFLSAGGLDAEQADQLGDATIAEMMAIIDPHFRERMNVMMSSMWPAMGRLMTRFEPDMRAGMAEAFAHRYNAAELDDISAFLKTPAGAKFGGGFMELATDPHYLGRMQAIMPEMMKAMPEIMKAPAEALAKLPKARTYEQLSKAERQKLEELFGSDPKKTAP